MGGDMTTLSLETTDTPAQRREALFREEPIERLERWALGTVWALHPRRIGNLPALARLWAADLISPATELPDPIRTINRIGMVGIARDLSVPTLMDAYRRGLFALAHFGPSKWYSPDERCVLQFDGYHIGKQVRRLLRQGRYSVTFDRDFEGVIKNCAGRRQGKWHLTWITPRVMRAFAELYDAGHVHSFEVWNEDGALVGGGYGVAAGRVFFTESQFSLEKNTSKLGLTVLNWHLAHWGFVLNDGKWETPTLADMGFRPIPRNAFLLRLAQAAHAGNRVGRWQVETDLKTVAAWQPGGAAAEAAAASSAA
jgi:leucyl/phenylalanyl-tRNA--protein transferase